MTAPRVVTLAAVLVSLATQGSPLRSQPPLEPVPQISQIGGPVQELLFTPDGRFLAAASPAAVEVLTVPELRVLRRWTPGRAGSFYASSSDANSLLFLRRDSLVVWTLTGEGPDTVIAVAAGVENGTYPLDDRSPEFRGRPHPPFLAGAGGRLVGSGDAEGGVWLLGPGGERSQRLETPDQPVKAFAHHPSRGRLALAFDDRRIVLYDAATGRVTARPPRFLGHADDVDRLAFSPDGAVLASLGDGDLLLWNAREGEYLREIDAGALSHDSGLAFSPDGALIAVYAYGGVRLCAVESGECAEPGVGEIREGTGAGRTVTAIAFHPDSAAQIIALGYDDGSVGLWHLDSAEPLAMRRSAHQVPRAVLSPDGRWLAVFEVWGEAIQLWDLADGTEPRILTAPAHAGLYVLAFSPDGRLLAGGGAAGSLRVWETTTGKEVTILAAHPGLLRALAFDARGGVLASGSDYPTLKLWNPATGQLLDSIPAGRCDYCIGSVGALAFLPDGTLASGGQTGADLLPMLRVWDPRTGREIQSAARPRISNDAIDHLLVRDRRLLAVTALGSQTFTLPTLDSVSAEPDVEEVAVGGAAVVTVMRGGTARIIAAPGVPSVWVERETPEAGAVNPVVTPNGNRALLTDGQFLRIQDTRTGAELARIIARPGSAEWLVFTPAGEFDGSPGTGSWLAWRAPGGGLLRGDDPAVATRLRRPRLLGRLLGPSNDSPEPFPARAAHRRRTNAPQ